MQVVTISRYPSYLGAVSALNRMDDMLDILSFLKAEDYVVSELKHSHSKTNAEARTLAKRITAHADLADQYARLCLNSPDKIAFLPGYYCILNLTKVVSLCGPYHQDFDHHTRWHGATYNAKGKSSQSVLTDEVRVRGGGSLALFYKTLTERSITSDRIIKMRDIYDLIPGISWELTIATGIDRTKWNVEFQAMDVSGGIIVSAKVVSLDGVDYNKGVRTIPPLNGFKKKPKTKNIFEKKFPATVGFSLEDEIRENIRPEFLLCEDSSRTSVFLEQNSGFPLPEEFATALAFFHLSSVCRYNPEFMQKLASSKEWPMLLALRRQGLYYFIQSAWSYLIQQNYQLS